VLDGNESARLNKHLVRDQQIASSAVRVMTRPRAPESVHAGSYPERRQTVADVETALRQEIAQL